jgi:diaminopimelate decarboxylase
VPTHEAGWAHAEGALRGPSWLRPPADPNALVPLLWSSTAHKVAGSLVVGGVSVPDLVANVNTPAYVLDEADFRGRARAVTGW